MSRRVRQRTEEGGSGSPPASLDTAADGSIQLNITTQLGLQFDNPVLSDVTLVWSDHQGEQRRFHCHKVVLASMSTYFHVLFTSGMSESSQSEVVLQDVDGDLMERVLQLLYGFPQDITPENVLTFVHLADFYGITQLQRRSEELLESFVTVNASNCCAKLAEATTLRCMQAQHHCRRILLSDFAAAVHQPAFTSLDLAVFAEVLEPDELICECEEVVLDGLATWWEAQTPKPPSSALDQLLPLIRWPLLTTATLSKMEHLHPALAQSAQLPQLLLEGFRYHSADELGKEEIRRGFEGSEDLAQARRCRLRHGMLTLAPILPDGSWHAPADAPPSPLPEGTLLAPAFPPSFSYVWNIPHFLSLSCLSMYSPAFMVNGHQWKIYIYPLGNNNHNRQLSVYLDSGITDSHETLQCNFKLAVINYKLDHRRKPVNAQGTVVKESCHAFCKRAKDWGFREFMPRAQLEDPSAGFLNGHTITLGVWLELS